MRAIVPLLLAAGAGATGLVAAWYWFQSTRVPMKTTQPNAHSIEMASLGLAAGALKAYQTVADLNKKAALCTAASVLLSAASAVAGACLD